MKTQIAIAFCIALCACLATSQDTSPGSSTKQVEDRAQIEKALKHYTDAYDRQDLPDVLKVFPDLANQKKELHKIQERFDNPRISNTRLELQLLEVTPEKDGVLAKCKRIEKYDEVKYSSYESGDATIGGMPVQRPGPTKMEEKKPVSKTGDAWITLHRDGDNWKIASISDKQAH